MAMAIQSTNNNLERHVGVNDAHDISGLSPWTWRRWAYDGKIASVKAGRRLLIPVSEIERVMREGLRPAREVR